MLVRPKMKRVAGSGGRVRFGRECLFADLIILPILDIYRKYYGWKVMSYILVTFYVTMAAAGYVVEFLFEALGIIPTDRNVAAITRASNRTIPVCSISCFWSLRRCW